MKCRKRFETNALQALLPASYAEQNTRPIKKATRSYYECNRIITWEPVKITSEKTLFLRLHTKESVFIFISLNPNVMKKNPSVRKSSSVLQSIKQIVHLLVESFESPQTKQFKRWKSYVAE